jgi:hypothetical protein
MSFCNEQGIPHSEFLSWDAEDRAKQLAYMMESAERCDMCGTAEWEWEENPFAYEAIDHFCKGCYMKSVFSDQEGKGLPGTNVRLIPVTPMRRAERVVQAKKRAETLRRARKKEDAGGLGGTPGRGDPDRGHHPVPAERPAGLN